MGAFTPSSPVVLSPEGSGGGGLLGWLGALLGDVKDLGTGLYGLGGQVVHDVGRGAALALPGSQSWGMVNDTDPTGFHVDDIVAAAPAAIFNDYASRYGGASNITQGVSEHPLSYILDLLGAGSLVGKGAEVAGASALRGTEGAATAERVAETLMSSGTKLKAAKQAGIGAGLADEGIGPILQKLLPSQTVKRVGETVIPSAEIANPVTRLATSPARRMLTEPLSVLEEQAADYARLISEAKSPADIVKLKSQQAMVEKLIQGAKDMGTSRLAKPPIAELSSWNLARKVMGASNAKWLRAREERLGQVMHALWPYAKRDGTFVERSYGVFDRLDTTFEDLGVSDWAMASGMHVTNPRVARTGGGVGTKLAPGLSDVERVAAQAGAPVVLERVDAIAQNVTEWFQEALTNPMKMRREIDPALLQDATERYLTDLYDIVRRRVQHEDASEFTMADVDLAHDDVHLMTAEWEQGLLRRGDDVEHLMERRYRPLGMKHGLSDEGAALSPQDWRRLDDGLREGGLATPVYYPYIENRITQGGFWDFVMNRSRIGARRASKDAHELQLKGKLLERDNYITDPIEAYRRRAARAVKAEEVQNLIDYAIKPAARRISSADQMTSGEMIFAPDGMWRFFRNKVAFDDVIDDMRSQGADVDYSVAEAIKHVIFKDQDELVTSGITKQGMELYAIPKALARQLDAYAKYHIGNSAVKLFWDKPIEFWRSAVLRYSPRWVLNNMLGNTLFTSMTGGARVRDVMAIAGSRIKDHLNEKYNLDLSTDILEALQELPGEAGVGSGFASVENLYTPKLGAAADDSRVAAMYARLSGNKVTQGLSSIGDRVTRFNSAIEATFRDAAYLKALERSRVIPIARKNAYAWWSTKDRIDKLLSENIPKDGGRVKAALDAMNSVMGDYATMGPIERNIVRRFIFPFWGFQRHATKLMLTFPVEYPGRAAVINQLAQINRDMLAQYGPVPEWLEGAVPMGPPGPGDIPFLASRGPNPFASVFEPPTAMLSPPLQVALETATGRDSFTGQPFTSSNVVTPYGSDQPYRVQRDDAGNIVGVAPLQGDVLPGWFERIMSLFPQYEALESTLAGGRPYDDATIIGALAGDVAKRNSQGEVQSPTDILEQIAKLAGIDTYEYDLQAFQAQQAREAQAALSAAQNREIP